MTRKTKKKITLPIPHTSLPLPVRFFKDEFNPTKEELIKWAYSDYYAPNEDFELFVVKDPYLVLRFVTDPQCPNKQFFLKALYAMVCLEAGFVWDIKGERRIRKFPPKGGWGMVREGLKKFIDYASTITDKKIRKFVARSKKFIASPARYGHFCRLAWK